MERATVMRIFLSGLAVLLSLWVSAPAFAHEDHDQPATARTQPAPPTGAVPEGEDMPMPGMAQDMDHGAMTANDGPKPLPQRLARWLGAMHPAAVHFPIALILVAALLEIAALALRRPVLTQGTRVIIALAAISAIAAAALGWLAMGMPGRDDVIHAYHRWLGTSIALLGMLSWWAKEHSVRRPGRAHQLIYVGLLTTTAAAVVVNGLLGGMLTHGVDHLMF